MDLVDLTAEYGKTPPEKCRVCGKSPASKIYGSIACASCKIFFLRVCTAGAPVPDCQNFRLCVGPKFLVPGKSRCVACRFEKCIQVGMLPENTARRRGCLLREKRSMIGLKPRGRPKLETQEIDDQPSTSFSLDTREAQLIAKYFSRPLLFSKAPSLDVLRELTNFERLLMSDTVIDLLPHNFEYTMEKMKMMDILWNPTIICPRAPVGYQLYTNYEMPRKYMSTLGGRMFARSLVLFADWFRATPEFWDLNEEDRINLFCRQVLRLNLLNDYYYTHKYQFNDGILSPLYTRLKANEIEEANLEAITDSFLYHMHFGMSVVIPTMRKVEMGDEEFVLIRNIIFFSSGIGLTENGSEIARKAFLKYSNILLEYLKLRFRRETLAIEKFGKLMEIPTYMQWLAQKMDRRFCKMVFMKESGIVGSLPEEIFQRL
ncbi:unnamed protein product, partial [Mesorhabditis belari]|uniref:Nuclear receptor domain-containing protein n=1 Tax=Mesorhabditis belari TaxID=2138241 RepID=A0AAF3EC13_9BILA